MRITLITVLFLLALNSIANINIRNGNFYVSYTDIDFPGGKKDITRSYNSFTTTIGLFGFGWGTELESRLYALPDGNVVVRWWGGGGEDIYEASSLNQQGLIQMVNEIIRYEIEKGTLTNIPVEVMSRKGILGSDPEARIKKYVEMISLKKALPFRPSPHSKEIWKRNVNQVIEWDGNKYLLQNWDDEYIFNASGYLSKVIEPASLMEITYVDDKMSGLIVDNKYRCTIYTDSSGKIKKFIYHDSTGNRETDYNYDNNDNLIYSKDLGNNEYRFTYDRSHNMVRINYTDSTFMEIGYDPATNRATRLRKKNGATTFYQYSYFFTPEGKINYLHYATTVKIYDSTGTLKMNEYYEYESRLNAEGDSYMYRRLIKTDTSYDEALYPPDIGNASYRNKNGREAWQKYDAKIRVTYLRMHDTVYMSRYNIMDKPEKFIIIDSLKKDTLTYSYSYSKNGDLIQTTIANKNYNIKGTKKSGSIEVVHNNIPLLIRFREGKPYSIENKQWGLVILNPIINKDSSNTSAADSSSSEVKIDVTDTRPLINPNEKQLRELFLNYKEVMEAKLIRHEWIWEKL